MVDEEANEGRGALINKTVCSVNVFLTCSLSSWLLCKSERCLNSSVNFKHSGICFRGIIQLTIILLFYRLTLINNRFC